MTLDEMASAIRSNIGSGTKEVGNFTYSIDQIKDEISNARSTIILEYSNKGLLNGLAFSQKIDKLELKLGQFPENGIVESNNPVFVVKLPKLAMTKTNSAISYLGPMDMSVNIKSYFSLDSLKVHKYTRTIKNRPYAFVDLAANSDGTNTVYITNTGAAPFKFITVRGIFDNPLKILQDAGFYVEDNEFPAPLSIQALIIDQVTNKYLIYYKKLSSPNEFNDQTDKT